MVDLKLLLDFQLAPESANESSGVTPPTEGPVLAPGPNVGGPLPPPPSLGDGTTLQQTSTGEPFYGPDPGVPYQPQLAQKSGLPPNDINAPIASPPIQPISPNPQDNLNQPGLGWGPISKPPKWSPFRKGSLISSAQAAEPPTPGSFDQGAPQQQRSLEQMLQDVSGDGALVPDLPSELREYTAGAIGKVAELLTIPAETLNGLIDKTFDKLGADDFVPAGQMFEDWQKVRAKFEPGRVLETFKAALEEVGIPAQVMDKEGLSGKIGANTVEGLLMLGGLAGASRLLANQGSHMAGRVYESLKAHPFRATLGEVFGGAPGSTIATENISDPLGKFFGGLVGGVGGSWMAAKGISAGAAAGRTIAKGVSKLAEAPLKFADKFRPAGSPPFVMPFKGQQPIDEPIMTPRVDPLATKSYAESQIAGDIAQVDDQIAQAIGSIQRTPIRYISGPQRGQPKLDSNGEPIWETSSSMQEAFRRQLEVVRKIAEKRQDTYWNKQMSQMKVDKSSGIPDAVREMERELHKYGTPLEYVPQSKMNQLKGMFYKPGEDGGFGKDLSPTIGELRGYRQTIEDMKHAAQSRGARRELVENLTRLEDMISDGIAAQHGGNVRVMQGVSFDKKMTDLFSRGPIADLFHRQPNGQLAVDAGQSVDALMKKFGGLKSVSDIENVLSREPRIPGQKTAYTTALTPGDIAELRALEDARDAAIRTKFREVAEGPNGLDARAAEKYIKANEGKIRDAAKLSTDLDYVVKEIGTATARRQEIEKSAFAKVAAENPMKVVSRLFGSGDPNPAKTAAEITRRLSGDKQALEGFRNTVMEKVLADTGGDPKRMQEWTRDPSIRRVLDAVYVGAPERLKRLDNMVDVLVKEGTKDDRGFFQRTKGFIMLSGRFGASRIASVVAGATGGGGLVFPAALSKAVTEMIEETLYKRNPKALLIQAIRDPLMEKHVLGRVPSDATQMRRDLTLLRRLLGTSHGLSEGGAAWLRGEGGAGDPSSFSQGIEPVPEPAAQQFEGQGQGAEVDKFRKALTGVPINPERWDAFIAGAPKSTNIEDRRGERLPVKDQNPFRHLDGKPQIHRGFP